MLVHEYLEYWAGRTPEAPCLEFAGEVWSYAELDSRANRIAYALARLGVRAGDRVAVIAENCPDWVELYFAAFKLGAVLVPLNYRLNPCEWARLVDDSGATALLAQREYVCRAETAVYRTVRVRLTLGDTAEAGWPALGPAAKDCSPDPLDRSADESDALYQMYTSGTTGTPKGAVLSHRAVDANIRQMDLALGLGEGDPALVVMPLFHAGAAVTTFSIIASGGRVLLHTGFDAAECVRVLDERDITTATFVPAMIVSMLDDVADVGARRYERLARIAYGAAPIGQATLRRAMEVFGCGFVQAYGMTECSSMVTLLDEADHRSALQGRPEILRSCGRPVAGTRIRIVDDGGCDLPPGRTGEILVCGPQLMTGYWNMPEATEKALRGGWMHTGDAGHVDRDGYLYLTDRLKDMIVSGGENIYPREIEQVLWQMPGVSDAAVIGVPDPRWGEAVKAVVVPAPGHDVSVDAVMAWCRNRIGGFKCPKSVDFVDELPRNPSGKVLKRVLRQTYSPGGG